MTKKKHSKSSSHSGVSKKSLSKSSSSVKSRSANTDRVQIGEDYCRMEYFRARTTTGGGGGIAQRQKRFTTAKGGSSSVSKKADYPPITLAASLKNEDSVSLGTLFEMSPDNSLGQFKTATPQIVTVTPQMTVKGQAGGVGIALPKKFTPSAELSKSSDQGARRTRAR